MGSHGKKVNIDLSKGYEKNEIQLRGIVLTTIALFLTCVVSFFLMWVLQNELEKYWVDAEKQTASPMDLTSQERLPPEPRLQAAPGFGVDDPKKGRINLELKHPQAEWEELQRIWATQEKEGQKVIQDGKEIVVTLPIEEAKKQLLTQGLKSGGTDIKQMKVETDLMFTTSTSGRKSAGIRR